MGWKGMGLHELEGHEVVCPGKPGPGVEQRAQSLRLPLIMHTGRLGSEELIVTPGGSIWASCPMTCSRRPQPGRGSLTGVACSAGLQPPAAVTMENAGITAQTPSAIGVPRPTFHSVTPVAWMLR